MQSRSVRDRLLWSDDLLWIDALVLSLNTPSCTACCGRALTDDCTPNNYASVVCNCKRPVTRDYPTDSGINAPKRQPTVEAKYYTQIATWSFLADGRALDRH